MGLRLSGSTRLGFWPSWRELLGRGRLEVSSGRRAPPLRTLTPPRPGAAYFSYAERERRPDSQARPPRRFEVVTSRVGSLVSPSARLVERLRQALEVCVEGDEVRALEEGPPARLVGDSVERALPEADGRAVAARQPDRKREEGGGTDVVRLRLSHGAVEVYRVNRRREVEAARSVEPVGDEKHRVAITVRREPPARAPSLHARGV